MKIDELFKAQWDWLKNTAGPEEKKLFRPIYTYLVKQEKLIEVLEREREEKKAVSMFPEMPKLSLSKQELIDRATKANMRKLRQPKENYYPLATRLKMLIDQGKVGDDEWDATLRWNKLTEEQAKELAKEG